MNQDLKSKETKSILPRPPIVVVMGHIDHGKSTLLDYIRKTNVTEKEAGGITQHISAYEAECEVGGQKHKITFLDTPGHEAFCSVREHGAAVADIAILIVSAEDGVKPQTVEALGCITKDGMPFIVAINKIDRPGANLDKTKQDLAEHGVLVEGWGGTIPVVPISAKTGEGVAELLEMVILQTELEELKGDKEVLAEGFVIESHLNQKQGISATLIIKNGSLKTGLFVATFGAYAPVRSIENYLGENESEASFSSPVKIGNWNEQPRAGAEFKTFLQKEAAVEFASQKPNSEKISTGETPTDVWFEILIKADTYGSLDAIEHELQKLGNEKIRVKIIAKAVGNISEKDVKTAITKKTLILGFNVEVDKNAQMLAMREKIEIKTYNIIYELLDFIKEKIEANTPKEKVSVVTGEAKIIRIFSKNKDKQVVGGRVEMGEIKNGNLVEIFRREALIGTGKVKELQTQKVKTDLVKEGTEFGLLIESKIELVAGDFIKATTR